jgi:rubredoxin
MKEYMYKNLTIKNIEDILLEKRVADKKTSGTSGAYRRMKSMFRYGCIVCGYVYDPAKGDAIQSIRAGILFEDLPDDWYCPECGVGQASFEKLEKSKIMHS